MVAPLLSTFKNRWEPGAGLGGTDDAPSPAQDRPRGLSASAPQGELHRRWCV